MKKFSLALCAAALVLAARAEVATNETVVVTATAISKYRAGRVDSALVPFTPEESPVVVDVLTEDYIRDRNPADLDNLLSFQPGVYTGGKTLLSRTAGQYTLRGLSGSQVLLNGAVPMSAGMGTFMDPTLIERVELPKGPVGAVSGGQGGTLGPYGAGGAVVVHQKRARADDVFATAEWRSSFAAGGAQRHRLNADVNWPCLGIHAPLWLRLPVGLDFNRPFYLPAGIRHGESLTLAPSLLVEGKRARMGLDTAFNFSDRPGYQGISIFQGKPRKTGPGAPYDWDTFLSLDDMRAKYWGATLLPWWEYDATDELTLRAGGGYAWNKMDYDQVGPSSGIPTVASPYEVITGKTIARSYNAYFHGVYKLETGPVTQTLVAGADWTQQERNGFSAWQGSATPRYVDRATLVPTRTGTKKFGVFLNDGIEAGNFRAVFGARYDDYHSNEGNTAGAWSPRAGVSYWVTPWLIPFANVSLTSAPNFGSIGEDGRELTDTWTATQCEGGLRVAPAKDFWVTASAFRIEQRNTPLSTTGSPNGPFVSDGRTMSKGVEISAVGNITRNWSANAAWTFIDFEDKNSDQTYNRFPPHAVSVFTTCKLEDSPVLKDAVLGFGYRYRDGFDQTMRGMYQGPDYRVNAFHVFDASVEMPLPKSWNLGGASFFFAVKNIFNQRYVESARNMQCFVGDPRTLEVAVRARF